MRQEFVLLRVDNPQVNSVIVFSANCTGLKGQDFPTSDSTQIPYGNLNNASLVCSCCMPDAEPPVLVSGLTQ